MSITQAAKVRLLTLFATKPDMDDELRLLRSRLSDRSVWIGRLVAGTDTMLNTLAVK